MSENERLNRLLGEIAAKEGVVVFGAEYKKFTGLSHHVHLSKQGFRFEINDYVSMAPDDVLREYLRMIVSNLKKKRKGLPEGFSNWLSSDEFIGRCRPLRIQRSRNISRSTVGKHRDLGDSLDRLIDMGLVYESDIKNSYYTWTSRPNYRKMGECNLFFRIVTISNALDSENVPEAVLDYVVYHETIHLRIGYNPGKIGHGKEFKELESLYPDHKQCHAYMSKHVNK